MLGALHLTSLHALRAYIGLTDVTVLVLNRNLLHVGAEHTIGHAMRVADAATRRRGLTANFTNLRHRSSLHVLWMFKKHPFMTKPFYYIIRTC